MPKEKNKSRKIGRHARNGQNSRYKAERRHEKSHVRRIIRHVERYGTEDKVAAKALMDYAVLAGRVKDAKATLGVA